MSTSGFVQRKPLSVLRFVQRKSPEGTARFARQQPSSTARLPQREPSSMARFAQQEPSATTGSAQQNPFSGSYHAWQDSLAMHDLRGLRSEKGPSLARCSPGVFPNGDLQGILNTWRAYLAKTSSFWMHGGDILPGKGGFTVRGSFGNASGRYFARMRRFVCPGCASRVLHSEGAPSPVQNEPRKCLVSAPQGFGVRCRPPRRSPRCGRWRRRC